MMSEDDYDEYRKWRGTEGGGLYQDFNSGEKRFDECLRLAFEGGMRAEQDKAIKMPYPIAKTMAELITPRQMVAIRAIASSRHLDYVAECERFFKQSVKIEELSRAAASKLIEHLHAQQEAQNL